MQETPVLFLGQEDPLEKEQVTHFNILWASFVVQLIKNLLEMQETWDQSLGWEDPWKRERLSTPVFWPGEFHGLYSPWGHKELDTTEQLSFSLTLWREKDC